MKIDILVHRLNMIQAHAGNANVFGDDRDMGPYDVDPVWQDHSYAYGANKEKWYDDEGKGVHL